MTELYSDAYWWPGATERIKEFTKMCPDCSHAGKNAHSIKPPSTLIPCILEPWQKLMIDITGPFATAPKRHRHIIVLIDYHSAFPELLFMDDVTAKKITDWLSKIFTRFGNPHEIVSNNRPQFTSQIFANFLAS